MIATKAAFQGSALRPSATAARRPCAATSNRACAPSAPITSTSTRSTGRIRPPIATTAETLDAFVQEGLVRFVGVSNYDARQMTAFQQVRPIDTLQPPYHLFRRDIEETILPFAREHGIGVLVYGPMAHGLLSGRMTQVTRFTADDWRATSDGSRARPSAAIWRSFATWTSSRRAAGATGSPSWRSPGRSPTRPWMSRSSAPAAPSRSARPRRRRLALAAGPRPDRADRAWRGGRWWPGARS